MKEAEAPQKQSKPAQPSSVQAATPKRSHPLPIRIRTKQDGHKRRSDETREKILQAALEIFADQGYAGARTREIADRAGVNQGLLTYYFTNKETLWKAAVDRIFELLGNSLQMLASEDFLASDTRDQIRRLAHHFIKFAAEHPELMRFLILEGKQSGERMEWLVEAHLRPVYEAHCHQIREAQENGIFPDVHPVHIHYLLLGAAASIFAMAPECRLLSGQDPSSDEMVKGHTEALISLLVGPRMAEKY